MLFIICEPSFTNESVHSFVGKQKTVDELLYHPGMSHHRGCSDSSLVYLKLRANPFLSDKV